MEKMEGPKEHRDYNEGRSAESWEFTSPTLKNIKFYS